MKKSSKDRIKGDESVIKLKSVQNKCIKCGATDISLNIKEGRLICNYCRHKFVLEKAEYLGNDLTKLEGEIIASGAEDIVEGSEESITLKCTSCGAEVEIDTSEALHAKCHWCRNILSINQQVQNGVIPDMVLPFKVTKEEAVRKISDFVKRRKFFAHPKFRKEFTTENVMGVYLPYMIVDVNSHAFFRGIGEYEIRNYLIDNDTYYDANLYDVEREFDLIIKGLTVESSSDKLNIRDKNKTNNIINSIMPFDIENSVKWQADYLKGYSSEKRDMNISELSDFVEKKLKI